MWTDANKKAAREGEVKHEALEDRDKSGGEKENLSNENHVIMRSYLYFRRSTPSSRASINNIFHTHQFHAFHSLINCLHTRPIRISLARQIVEILAVENPLLHAIVMSPDLLSHLFPHQNTKNPPRRSYLNLSPQPQMGKSSETQRKQDGISWNHFSEFRRVSTFNSRVLHPDVPRLHHYSLSRTESWH